MTFFALLVQKPLGQYKHIAYIHSPIHKPVALVDAIPIVDLMPHVPFLSCIEPLSSTPVRSAISSCFSVVVVVPGHRGDRPQHAADSGPGALVVCVGRHVAVGGALDPRAADDVGHGAVGQDAENEINAGKFTICEVRT